jgi:hypothetical protein
MQEEVVGRNLILRPLRIMMSWRIEQRKEHGMKILKTRQGKLSTMPVVMVGPTIRKV